jgi:hypothetical protein
MFLFAVRVSTTAQSVQRLREGEIFRTTQSLIQWVPGLFPRGKAVGGGVNRPPQSIAEVKEREELYLYSPSGPSWPLLGRTLPFPSVT